MKHQIIIAAALAYLAFASPYSTYAAEPNNSFETSTILEAGVLTVSDNLTPGAVTTPDTLIGVRDGSGAITQIDDNSSVLGNGFASGVTGAPLTSGSDIVFAVTGVGDDTFNGSHNESGLFDVRVQVFDDEGTQISSFFSDPRNLQPGGVQEFSFGSGTPCPGCTYNANIDNAIAPPVGGDIDFFTFNGLTSNVNYTFDIFEETAGLETLVYRYNSDGVITATNVFSRIRGETTASGELTFAVTGNNDFNPGIPGPDGEHLEDGAYQVFLTVGTSISGDFNADGAVDSIDYAVWRENLGQSNAALMGNGTNDLSGLVVTADFLLWQANYGRETPTESTATATPEPGALAILLIAASAPCLAARRLF